jgi:hypothetical protein
LSQRTSSSTDAVSLAAALARIWSPEVNAVEFGGTATKRPVSEDMFIVDKDGVRRLKLAEEHYSKFVSELWYSFRYAIEADQMRGLDAETIADGAPREFMKVKGDRIEVESKRDMKKRTGKSPDLMDAWLSDWKARAAGDSPSSVPKLLTINPKITTSSGKKTPIRLINY